MIWSLLFSSLLPVSSFSNEGASVQLFEWSWTDVATECETFLGPKGYKGVQISPPTEHIQGTQWWTRYQPVTYNFISRSGNETQFTDMINRCKAKGVTVIVDAVINHMAAGSGVGIGGSSYGNRNYPFYSQNDFHHYSGNGGANCQVTNYKDKYNVQYCDLVGLPDLLTSSTYVQETIAKYLNRCAQLGAGGIRIDAAKHQDANELYGITSRLPANFWIGTEVIGAPGEAVQPSMYYNIGQVSEFYYADYLNDNIIPENKMNYLQSFGETWGLMPAKYADVFMDNHDTQRNGRARLTYKNGDLYTFANMFMLSWPYGNARVMSSYYFSNTDQGPPSVGVSGGKYCMDNSHWVCEHRWGPIANMVAWRKAAGSSPVSNWVNGNGNQISFSRGGKAFIAFNRGSSAWTTSAYTSLPQGVYCNIIGSVNDDNVATCPTVTVDSKGWATFTVPPLKAVAMHVNAKK